MSKRCSYPIVGLCCVLSGILHAEEIQRVSDGKEAQISVPLIRNVDKKIMFEEPVAFGVTASFKEHFRVQSFGNTIYLTALKPTEKIFRVSAKGQNSKRNYIIAVQATKNPRDEEPVTITWFDHSSAKSGHKTIVRDEISPVNLLRYASQNLYANKDSIEPLRGVRAVPFSLPANMDWLYEGSPLKIKPLVAFRAGSWTVTAFEAVNKSVHRDVDIDVMKISTRVNAYGAMSQHKYVGTQPTNNMTVIYVVTQGDLANSLNVGV